MNGANCSSSCHISRVETKPLLTQKTMSLCKSQRPTETSPQPRTTRWATAARPCPRPAATGAPGRHRGGAPSALPACAASGAAAAARSRRQPSVPRGLPRSHQPWPCLPVAGGVTAEVAAPTGGSPSLLGRDRPVSSPLWHQHGLELCTQPESGCQEGAEHPTAACLEQQPGR